ncbi:MAG: radical SAM protein [Clostridiales bacterium]|nr:radical SAM protein [Clostridiales bacterium]
MLYLMVGKNMREVVLVNKKKSNHYYYFNKSNGLCIRAEYPGYEEPFWAEEGPELLDISITNYCEKNCSFCYRNSSINGQHMSLKEYESILSQLKNTHTYQIALGGGNPNQHPDFVEILRMTREDYGIVPSYTTNGMGLTEEIISASKLYCGAVAVSYYEPVEKFVDALVKLKSSGIKTNIHYLLTSKSIGDAIELIESPPEYFGGVNAIVFLNYKPVGKNSDESLLLKYSSRVEEFFVKISNHDLRKFKVGFDSCSISGIVEHLQYSPLFIESCEAGRFSAFISENLILYPCSFMESKSNGVNLKDKSICDGWLKSEEFIAIRESMQNNQCIDTCSFAAHCSGGCTVFQEINLCESTLAKREK